MLMKKIQRHDAESVDQAAKRRAEHRRDDGRDRSHPEGRRALGRREGVEHNSLLIGLQSAAEESLGEPEENELRQVLR